MNGLKTFFLLCGCTLTVFSEQAAVGIDNELDAAVPQETIPQETIKTDSLKVRNPFIPFKNGSPSSESTVDSSDFILLSVVTYPDHREFSITEKTKVEPFWISSDNRYKDEKYGLNYWNYYPSEGVMVVQDSFSGNLISIQQKKVDLNSTSSKSSFLSSGNDWTSSSLLESMNFDENNEEIENDRE